MLGSGAITEGSARMQRFGKCMLQRNQISANCLINTDPNWYKIIEIPHVQIDSYQAVCRPKVALYRDLSGVLQRFGHFLG